MRLRDALFFDYLPKLFEWWGDPQYKSFKSYKTDYDKRMDFYPNELRWQYSRCFAAYNPSVVGDENWRGLKYGATGVHCTSLDFGALFQTDCSQLSTWDINNLDPAFLNCRSIVKPTMNGLLPGGYAPDTHGALRSKCTRRYLSSSYKLAADCHLYNVDEISIVDGKPTLYDFQDLEENSCGQVVAVDYDDDRFDYFKYNTRGNNCFDPWRSGTWLPYHPVYLDDNNNYQTVYISHPWWPDEYGFRLPAIDTNDITCQLSPFTNAIKGMSCLLV